jgi:hypothetical protein
MSWVGRFGNRPHRILTQEELFAIVVVAQRMNRHCELCDGGVAGVIHCNDCGYTLRLCDKHRPTTPEVQHVKKLHAALCRPVPGSN